jgi:mannose/fructose-specific phosphotransferase system component IIA
VADVVSHGDNGSLFHKLINALIGLEEKIVIVDCLLVVETSSPNEPKTRLGIFFSSIYKPWV